ncbi:MAG: ATP-binding protein, partial [bacterium]|nr:ATP-binding protein [bacterium]
MHQGHSDKILIGSPRTLFKPATWLAKIDFINHLILFNNVLITVLSEKNGGKTSFTTLLQSNLDDQIKSIFMTIKPPCDREQIISDMAAQLHLNYDSDADLANLAKQINERKAHVLLIIDDAHHLPEALITEMMWVIKNQEDFGFFHLCLVSDYSIIATLNNLAVDPFNNLIHSIELSSLNENETRIYVLQRAMSARLINKP